MRVIVEPAGDCEAIATKLDVIARVLRTLDGDVGKAELGMARQIVTDVERLLAAGGGRLRDEVAVDSSEK
jgi:hypothetical protein